MNDKKLEVVLPIGKLLIEEKGALDEYPGIWISFVPNDKSVITTISMVEYEQLKGKIQTITYNEDSDEPTNIIEHN